MAFKDKTIRPYKASNTDAPKFSHKTDHKDTFFPKFAIRGSSSTFLH